MTWLLDTCVLSDFVKGDRGTMARLKGVAPSEVAVTAITVMEIEYGLARLSERSRHVAPMMRSLLSVVGNLPFTPEDVRAAASLRAALERKGRPIGAYDVLIAGAALARGLTLVTANRREFERVSGLRVESWRSSR